MIRFLHCILLDAHIINKLEDVCKVWIVVCVLAETCVFMYSSYYCWLFLTKTGNIDKFK